MNHKFRYYITNLLEGKVEGTDNIKVAEEASGSRTTTPGHKIDFPFVA